MKKGLRLFFILLIFFLYAYGAKTEQAESYDTLQVKEQITQSKNEGMQKQRTNDQEKNEPAEKESDSSATVAKEADDNYMKLKIGEYIFTATLADNSSAKALKEMLEEGPITINMRDYANMEKVGPLGINLPRNDEQITTEPGDLILYQGNAFVIYYASNSWNFTRIGKINDVTQKKLKEALGIGDVKVTLSLN